MFIFSFRLKQSNLQIFGCVLLVILITGNIESAAVERFRRGVEKNQNFTDLNNVLKNLNKYCDSQSMFFLQSVRVPPETVRSCKSSNFGLGV
jgi:hypothetical protein